MFLQGFAAPVLDMRTILKAPLSPPLSLTDSCQPSSFQLDRQMLDRLGRFQNGTVLSLGNADKARLYQRESIELACRAPYLMHIIQTLTIIHDRYLSRDILSKSLFADICYHWSHGVSLFNRKLSSPIEDEDRDPLWSTAALCGIIACAAVEATGPEDAWPLKPPDDSDLDWLRMNEGKGAVFKLTKPMRREQRVSFLFGHLLRRKDTSRHFHGQGGRVRSWSPAYRIWDRAASLAVHSPIRS